MAKNQPTAWVRRTISKVLTPDINKLEARANTTKLIKCLEHRAPEVRSAAARALGRLKCAQASGSLITQLLDSDNAVRTASCQALDEVNPHWRSSHDAELMLNAIIEILSPQGLNAIARRSMTAQFGPYSLLNSLSLYTNLPSSYVISGLMQPIEISIWALGEIGNIRAISVLTRLGWDKDLWLNVQEALIKIRSSNNPEAFLDAVILGSDFLPIDKIEPVYPHWGDSEAARQLLPRIISAATPDTDLTNFLRSDLVSALRERLRERWTPVADRTNPLYRAAEVSQLQDRAIKVLGTISDERAFSTLMHLLSIRVSDVAVAKQLSRKKDKRALLPLILALAHAPGGNTYLNGEVLGALNVIDPHWKQSEAAKAAVPSLVELLENSQMEERRNATQILGMIREPTTVEPLISRLNDTVGWVKLAAATALGNLKDSRAVSALIVALGDQDRYLATEVREAAAKALSEIIGCSLDEIKLGQFPISGAVKANAKPEAEMDKHKALIECEMIFAGPGNQAGEIAETRKCLSEILDFGSYDTSFFYQAEPEYNWYFESETDYLAIAKGLRELHQNGLINSLPDLYQIRRIGKAVYCEMWGRVPLAFHSITQLRALVRSTEELSTIAEICEGSMVYLINYVGGKRKMSTGTEVLQCLVDVRERISIDMLRTIGLQLADASKRCPVSTGRVDLGPLHNCRDALLLN